MPKLTLKLTFPPLPDTLARITELMRREDVELKEVISLIEHDPSAAAFVLKLANSPIYGLRGKVSSLQRAVVLLGIKSTLQNLMSRVLLRTRSGFPEEVQEIARALILHNVATALLVRKLLMYKRSPVSAGSYAMEFVSEAFTMALLHDFGKLVLLLNFPEKAGKLYRMVLEDPFHHSSFWLEQAQFGINHLSLIKEMGKRFNFPMYVQYAIMLHHAPMEQLREAPEAARRLSLALIAANLSAHAMEHTHRLEVRERVQTHPVWPLLLEAKQTLFSSVEEIQEMLPQFWEETRQELETMA